MAQARTINEKEVKRLFAFVGTQRNPIRNKAMLALSYYCGLRAKEIASLTIGDVMKANGTIKDVADLSAEQTKCQPKVKLPHKSNSIFGLCIDLF